jgi:Holliday junction resolvase RusA-like endonuclease
MERLLDGPLLLITHYRIPYSADAGKMKERRAHHCVPHIGRPDGDNLEKFLNDCLTGIVWKDDSRVAWHLRSKSYTKEPEGECLVYVTELKKGLPDYHKILEEIHKYIDLESELWS